MLEWIASVLASEFLWGTVLGIVLSVLTARVGIAFQNHEQRRRVKIFSADLILNLQDYARALDEQRERNNVIYYDFIALIENEVGIWGRNREHTILLDDDATKRMLRDYFAKTAKLVVELKIFLQNFENLMADANRSANDGEAQRLRADAQQNLQVAHEKATRLVAHILQSMPESQLIRLTG